MGRGKGKGDYSGWIARLIENIEDVEYTFSNSAWLEFANSKIAPRQKHNLTAAQVDVLQEVRTKAMVGVQKAIGAEYSKYAIPGSGGVRYRDKEGRWGRKGAFVSRAKVNEHLREQRKDKLFDILKYGDEY